MLFAHAIYLGERKWNIKEVPDILVTLSEELNIVVPANEASPAIYIDVPIESILEISFDHSLVPDSQQPTYGLVLQLDVGATINCILNATGYAEHHVALMFSSERDAHTLKRLLTSTNFRPNDFNPHNRSETTDVSEQIPSDDELAAIGPAKSQILTRTGSLDTSLMHYGNVVSTINPSMLERVPSSHHASTKHHEDLSSSMVEQDEDSLIVGHRVEMAVEGIDVSQNDVLVEKAIEGIDVSQSDSLDHRKIQHRNIQPYTPGNHSPNARVKDSQAIGKGMEEPIGRFNGGADIGSSRSSRWHTGLNGVGNLPEFRGAKTIQQAVSSAKHCENEGGPQDQNGEHDLYYASPKVTKVHRRSPRLMARDNSPKKLEQTFESTVRQASATRGPPIELSRQLRNFDGVVETHTEQTVDEDLTVLAKNDPVDVQISVNGKKSKASAPANRNGMKGSRKPTKQLAQSTGRAIVTEEPADTLLNNHNLSPSPKRVNFTIRTYGNKKKAPSTLLKATEAPRNDQKKAKPMPTKATTAAPSKGSASKLKGGLQTKAKANVPVYDSLPKGPSGKKDTDDDDAIWDVDQAHAEEGSKILRQPRQTAKTAKKYDAAPKTKKKKVETKLYSDKTKANNPSKALKQDSVARTVKAKPLPATLSRPRLRRTAAINANKKIQGLKESDEIVEDEETVPVVMRSKRHITLAAAKTRKDQKVKNGGDDRLTPSGKAPTAKLPTKDFIPDSISPDSSDKQRPDSVSDSKANSSPEKVDLVRGAPAEALSNAASEKRDDLQEENPNSATETSVLRLHLRRGNHANPPDPVSAEQGTEISGSRVDLVPGSVLQVYESITETERAPISSRQDRDTMQGHNHLDATRSLAQKQLERVSPCIDDEPLEHNSNPDRVEKKVTCAQAPIAPMTVKNRGGRTSPRSIGAVEESLPEPSSTRRDPFMVKLNASLPQLKDISAKVKSSDVSGFTDLESKAPNTTKPAELESTLRESKSTTFSTPGAISSRAAKKVENTRRPLKLAMQVGGEADASPLQSLKPIGESISASRIGAKRKIEQVENTGSKRVKIVPCEQLEKPANEAEKTPPPVVTNRPLVIGFSASGPRNQGTISTKKSKSPKNLGTSASNKMGLRKHEAPKPATDQTETEATSIQDVLEVSLKDVQHDARNVGGAQEEARDSPLREQAEHLRHITAGLEPREGHIQGNVAEKRKLTPFLDESAPGGHEQLSKRRKRDIQTPPAAQKHHAQMLPDMSLALGHDRSQRISSQNTRVNENGSPMPFFITRNEDTTAPTAEEQYPDEDDGKDALAEARLEEQFVWQDDDPILSEPILPPPPLVSAVSTSQPKVRAYQSLSNNSKQVPSSPHASSAFGTMPPHHLYHDGEIVNAETKESIQPTKPQDPFLGATQNPHNSFLIALRKATQFAAKHLVSGANGKQPSDGLVIRQDLNVSEDPDKTLVEPSMRRRYKQGHVLDNGNVSDSSSNSQSSTSTQASQPGRPSEEDSDAEAEARWRKGLEPHQENMLECLLTISHVRNKLAILLTMH